MIQIAVINSFQLRISLLYISSYLTVFLDSLLRVSGRPKRLDALRWEPEIERRLSVVQTEAVPGNANDLRSGT